MYTYLHIVSVHETRAISRPRRRRLRWRRRGPPTPPPGALSARCMSGADRPRCRPRPPCRPRSGRLNKARNLAARPSAFKRQTVLTVREQKKNMLAMLATMISDPTEPVRALWERMNARDWEGILRLLDGGFQASWPQTGERIPSPAD